ncbi:MAG: EAL domain-containing protein [Acidobacteria bacterium]|nr:EAL domain-containing protein [Acidobacteriota bacterium]
MTTADTGSVGEPTGTGRAEGGLEYYLECERTVSSISARLISVPTERIDEVVGDAVERIGTFAGVDRSYLFVLEEGGETASNIFEWCAPGIEPQIANLQNIPTEAAPYTTAKLKNLEVVIIDDVANLPEEAALDKKLLEAQGVQSCVIVPLAVSGKLIGLLGYDMVRERRAWQENTIGPLQIIGEMLSSAIARKWSEEALRASEERYRKLFETTPDLILLHREGQIVYINEAGARLLGASVDEIVGADVLSIIEDTDHEQVQNRIEAITKTGKEIDLQRECFLRRDGSSVDVEVSARRLVHGGKPSVLVVARDVSPRLEAERIEKRTASLLQSTLESTDDGILAIDLDGRIVTYNRRLLEIWSISPSTLEFGSEQTFLRAMAKFLTEPDAFTARWRSLRLDPLKESSDHLELKDGRILEMFSKPQMLDGKPVGRVWSFSDVSQRREAERALRESVERFRLLFERNLAGVYRSSVDGRILDCNDACARILGYESRNELMMVNAADVYFESEERETLIRDLERRKAFTNRENCFRKKDGSPVWVLESATLLDATVDGPDRQIEGTMIDITEIKRAEATLRESEERYRLMTQYSTDMISRLTPDWLFMYASPAAESLLGYAVEDLVGTPLPSIIHQDDRESFLTAAQRVLQERDGGTVSYRVRHQHGGFVWIESTIKPVLSEETGSIVEIVTVSRDVSERRRAQEEVEYQAYHDPLTALPNRMLFLDRLSVALNHAKRNQTLVAVMFLDLDNFKFINDTLGHSVGDALLKEVAARLSSSVRLDDTVSRMGGDEFTLLTDIPVEDDARTIARKILDAVAEPFLIDSHELFITTSIGIALYPEDGEDSDTLLKNADSAMYRAKALGRNNYQLCSDSNGASAEERLTLEHYLRGAVERDELEVYYQPQVDLVSNRIIGMEALVRWNHPEKGLIQPNDFIPLAEETRLIFTVGEWVLRQACTQLKKWQNAGHRDLRVAVNLSVRQFQHRGLVGRVRNILEETGLEPRFLELEITESTAMKNAEWTQRMLADLRGMGVTLTMDDFGTGYSSLNYLKRFALDVIKIDRDFIVEMLDSEGDAAIVSAIVTMCRGLGLQVIAEGVETEEQKIALRDRGCELMQGYLFGHPLPAPQMLDMLKRQI